MNRCFYSMCSNEGTIKLSVGSDIKVCQKHMSEIHDKRHKVIKQLRQRRKKGRREGL